MHYTRIDITSKFVFYLVAGALLFLGAWEARQVILSLAMMVFVAFIISSGLRPLVAFLERKKIKRAVAVPVIYLAGIFIMITGIVLLTGSFVSQMVNLINALPGMFRTLVSFLENTLPFLSDAIPFSVLEQEVGTFVSNTLNTEFVKELLSGENILAVLTQTLGLFSTVAELLISFVTVIILSSYMLIRTEPVYEDVLGLLPEKKTKAIRRVLKKIDVSLGYWLAGQISLMVIIGVITYFLVLIPGFFDPGYRLDDFAFPIAILAGLLEALPNVGPMITLVIGVFLALGTSGLPTVLYIAVAFTLLQNAEGVFIVPMVMKKAVGIDPILSIIGVLGGFQIAGVMGAILAIPLIGIAQIITIEISDEYKRLDRQRPRLVEV